ncbi:hypothetical protein MC885_018724 [Smutsia gigantea]|nr:hypothetical protein MC885_018724 [Smutsia gigantea]
MWLGTSGKSGSPGRCLENPLPGYHPAQFAEWAVKGISKPSVTSRLGQEEEPWVLPLHSLEARKVLRAGHTDFENQVAKLNQAISETAGQCALSSERANEDISHTPIPYIPHSGNTSGGRNITNRPVLS